MVYKKEISVTTMKVKKLLVLSMIMLRMMTMTKVVMMTLHLVKVYGVLTAQKP